jgi:hypothetical protein
MLVAVDKKSEIKKAQATFKEKMNDVADKHGRITIGGKGWHQHRKVHWNKNLGIWWAMKEEGTGARYWNSFGTGEPRWNTKHPHSIVCEINLPKGKNRRIPGLVAKEEKGKTYLLHSGRIGGGRKGIGKSLFVENFRGEWEIVGDGESSINMALVAALDSERFPQQVADFVHEVERIKHTRTLRIKLIKGKPIAKIYPGFKGEFSGVKAYDLSKRITSKCDHGLIVNSLERKLKSKGLSTGSTKPMDLYVLSKKGEIKKLFEIKTDSTIGSCYEAIGQLLFRSNKLNIKPVLIAVFPNTLAEEYELVFEKLGINVLRYRWIENQPHFEDLQAI